MRTITSIMISIALVFATLAAAQMPPQPVEGTFTLEGICAFPVTFDVTGKGSRIDLPSGSWIITGPGLYVTLTNADDPSQSVTLNITGPITRTVLPDGRIQADMNGRNLFFDDTTGLLLLIGHWRAVTDATETELFDLGGRGQRIEICPLLA
jgi:hypothetical protein